MQHSGKFMDGKTFPQQIGIRISEEERLGSSGQAGKRQPLEQRSI